MLSIKCLVLINIVLTLTKCEIPNLSVKKFDREIIAKKRQDTLEMCKIFTEENEKLMGSKPKIVESYKYTRRSPIIKFKQDNGNSSLSIKTRNKREVVKEDILLNLSDFPKRTKRSTGFNVGNTDLKTEESKKIGNSVSNTNIQVENNGQKISHRKDDAVATKTMNLQNTTTNLNVSRRLYFAPSELIGPEEPLANDKITEPAVDDAVYEKARWKYGIVPYFIDPRTYDAQLQDEIRRAFDYIEKATCIRLQKLRERPTDRPSLQHVSWVYIANPAGVRQCVHTNERRDVNGVQMSVLGYDCMSLGDIVHEVMHILGFSHEHTRPDRDRHINVLWSNIKPGYKKYFEISPRKEQYSLDHLPYDYASILHYPPRAFSRNGQVTIQVQPGIKIGQREGLSEIDLEKIGAVYSGECVERNKDYLLKTCPSVVKSTPRRVNVTQQHIEDYFKDRLWPYGIVSYKMRDRMEFSVEEKENIKAVIDHIQKETCIRFQDMAAAEMADDDDDVNENDSDQNDALNTDSNNHNDPNGNFIRNSREDHSSNKRRENVAKNELSNMIFDQNSGDTEKHIGDKRLNYEVRTALAKSNKSLTDAISPHSNITATRYQKSTTTGQKLMNSGRHRKEKKDRRRHAANTLILTRSAAPGCKCPDPGKPNGNAVLEINADCFNSVNDLLHLFVHVLGLDHQHNMHDRDHYLHIVWRNLSPEISNELRVKLPPAASVGFPYDYQSVTHYPWLQIREGITNIMYPIWNDGWAMGHWQGLSSFDVQKLNLLYFSQCADRQKLS